MFMDKVAEIIEVSKRYHFTTEEISNYSINILCLSNFVKGFQCYMGFTSFDLTVEMSLNQATVTVYERDGVGYSIVRLNMSCWLAEKPEVFISMLSEAEKLIFEKVKAEAGEWE